jgi:predicted acetyltransferase
VSQPQLHLSKVGPEASSILGNLFEFYVHDMSEWLGIDTLPDGSYSYDTSTIWTKGQDAHLARLGDSLAGFVLTGSADRWLGPVGAHEIVEFFVLRKFRRSGVGRQMAMQLWDNTPGEWLVRVVESNVPALPFWRRTIADYSRDAYTEERRTVGDRAWRFFRFRSG